MCNGVNFNALTSQDVSDMGDGPVFYSTLAQLEKVERIREHRDRSRVALGQTNASGLTPTRSSTGRAALRSAPAVPQR